MLDIEGPERVAALFPDSDEAVIECAYDATTEKCMPLCLATGPVDSWSVLHPPAVEEDSEEQLVASETAPAGPVVSMVDGQPTLCFTTRPTAPTTERPAARPVRHAPAAAVHRAEPAIPPPRPDPEPIAERGHSVEVEPPQYIPLDRGRVADGAASGEELGSVTSLAADRPLDSAAQRRLMERLANGKRFEFRAKDPEPDFEADTASMSRARVARKPLQLRAKQELEQTILSEPVPKMHTDAPPAE